MKKSLRYALGIVALVILAFILVRVFTAKPPKAKKASIPPVIVERPERTDIKYILEYDGDVLPILQANLFSRVNGLIDALYTDMGRRVRAGQLVALIDTSAAYQAVAQTAATYFNAKATEARERDLASKNLASQQDLDNAVAAMQAAKAAYEANRVMLDYAKIRAPFAGVVTKRWLDPGSVVTSNPIVGNSNSTIFTIMDLDTVKIDVNVLDKDVAEIPEVTSATATVDVLPNHTFRAVVSRSAEAVTTTTRTMPVEILIPNKDHSIKPGEFARVTLVTGGNPRAITLPPQAVLRQGGQTYVYLVQDSAGRSVARRRDVQTGVLQNNRLEITAGLDGTENVVVVGQTFVKANSPVSIVKPSRSDTTNNYSTGNSSGSPE